MVTVQTRVYRHTVEALKKIKSLQVLLDVDYPESSSAEILERLVSEELERVNSSHRAKLIMEMDL